MIKFELVTDLDEWANEIAERFMEALDLRPVAESLAEIAIEDNATARMSGLDKDGSEFEPITEATRKWRRKTHRGDGPPLDPDYGASSVVTDMTTEIERVDAFTWELYGVWPDWVPKQRDGVWSKTRNEFVKRDAMGVTPEGRIRMQEAFSEGVDQLMLEA